jgi:hypothetical protein
MIDIVVINFNYQNYLVPFLNSLIECQKYSIIKQKIIIVDNNSTDNSRAALKTWYEHLNIGNCQIELLNENRGYAYAVNYGAKQGLYPYIMILNSDMLVLDYYWKETFLKTFRMYENTGVVGCKLINQFNKVVGAGTEGTFQQRKFRAYNVEDSDDPKEIFNKTANCVNVSGCCYMVKREVFDKIGGFDEDFFMYHEEEYFSFKVQLLLKMKIMYTPLTKFLHYFDSHKSGNELKYMPKSHGVFIKKCKEELNLEGVQS